ncbi:C-type lectin 37Db-like [Drosophila ananassae]|uniref:C-type lectin 37Db-like n=1 Tax=Drosophila ananassae TaxID=7217 RepID=UPI001CFFDDFD|nr:C-type lectin 37Db-like [Drosophila ananassae]
MITAKILGCVLLILSNYNSQAEFPKNSSSVGEFQNAVDQCQGFCNQIQPILNHIGVHQPVWNKSETRTNVFENLLQNIEAKLAAFEASKRKPKPDLNKFFKIGSRYFHIEEMHKLNWYAAFKACREIGGRLAIIQNEEELNKINKRVEELNHYWLGINALVRRDRYKMWPFGAKQSSFIKWLYGYHNAFSYGERCMVLLESHMLDAKCDEKHPYICEAVIED